jgi:pyruvate kinase
MALPATKIVCTIGPASRPPRVLSALIRAGMSVSRLNFSHGTHEEHDAAIRGIRREAARQGRHVAILQDLQGPKIRLGVFEGGEALLAAGDRFTLTTEPVVGNAAAASVSYRGLPDDVKRGDTIFLNDGFVRLAVQDVRGREVRCRVVDGGVVGDRKGVNIPGRPVSLPSFTKKDHADLAFGLSRGVDYVTLSFVRSAGEVRSLKKRIRAAGKDTPVIAKLEKAQAIENLQSILAASDGVIVARGDLGVETAIEEVPHLQKRIIREATLAGVTVITATQMLESMTWNRIPTRAEASDVANAVIDGGDALLLSGETAVGAFPAESVETMRRLIAGAEALVPSVPGELSGSFGVPGVIAEAACRSAARLAAQAIVVFTRSGLTARILSKFRPGVPVIAFTPRRETAVRLALCRGVEPHILASAGTTTDGMIERAAGEVRRLGRAASGENLVFVSGSAGGHGDQMRVVRV